MHSDEVRFRIIPWRAGGDHSLYGATGMVLAPVPPGGVPYVAMGREAAFYPKHGPNSASTIHADVGPLFAGQSLPENSTASASTYLYAFCSFRL
jgi:hypothetical protein